MMVERKTAQIVCRGAGFGKNDLLKIITVQTIKFRALRKASTVVFKVV